MCHPGLVFWSASVTTNLLCRHLQFQKLSFSAQYVPGRMDLHKTGPVNFGLEAESQFSIRGAMRAENHFTF
jgi:hypothetical protein